MWKRRAAGALMVAGLLLGGVVCQAATEGAKKLNPDTGNPEKIQEGKKLFLQLGCSACHGAGGGGGMGPPLTKSNGG